MMFITKIQAVTKQKYSVEINGQPAFVLYRGELSRFKIKENTELSEADYIEITEEILTKRAKKYAMHLLERMDRTELILRQKLEQAGYPEIAVEAAVAYVSSYGYINDKRYAQHYIECRKGRTGRARLKMELRQKGVQDAVIEEVLEEAEGEDPREVIRNLVEKKRRTEGPMDEKEKRKIYGYLMRRGFSSSDILCVIRENDQF